MEERDALVRRGNACQDLRRQKDKLREARRWEDEEDKKEAMKQQKIRKACVKKAVEEAEVKAARLQGVLDKARKNLIWGIMAGEGEKRSSTRRKRRASCTLLGSRT